MFNDEMPKNKYVLFDVVRTVTNIEHRRMYITGISVDYTFRIWYECHYLSNDHWAGKFVESDIERA